MRITNLHKICILALATLTSSFAVAQTSFDPSMEATASTDCAFCGQPQVRDNLRGLEKVPTAKFQKVNDYADNPSVDVDRSVESELAPVGELTLNRTAKDAAGNTISSVGTAFIVSPCYILTNAHNLFDKEFEPQPGKDYSATFRAGVGSASVPFAGRVTASPVLWGEGDYNGAADWVIMKMSACVGKRPEFGWFEPSMKQGSERVGQSVVVASFRGDKATGTLSVGAGKVKSDAMGNGTLLYNGSTSPGSSGSAVLAMENGQIAVAGLHTRGLKPTESSNYHFASFNNSNANEFINAAEIFGRADVKKLLDQDKAAFGQPNPLQNRMSRPLPGKQTQMAES